MNTRAVFQKYIAGNVHSFVEPTKRSDVLVQSLGYASGILPVLTTLHAYQCTGGTIKKAATVLLRVLKWH